MAALKELLPRVALAGGSLVLALPIQDRFCNFARIYLIGPFIERFFNSLSATQFLREPLKGK